MVMDLDRRYLWAAALLVLILVFAGGMQYANLRNREQTTKDNILKQSTEQTDAGPKVKEDVIQIYVTGAVEKPGVYRLPPDARVFEAIDMAQSLPTANLKNINLAQKLEDGQAIVVPAAGDETAPDSAGMGIMTSSSSSNLGGSGKVNINTASAQELDEKLTGIGPTLAQRIVDYRNLHGPFSKIEDLNNVSGIGDKKFADLKDMIVVR